MNPAKVALMQRCLHVAALRVGAHIVSPSSANVLVSRPPLNPISIGPRPA